MDDDDDVVEALDPPELKDWDEAEPPPSPLRTAAVGIAALGFLVVIAVLLLAVVGGDDDGTSRSATALTTPTAAGSVESYNPTGYDGVGAASAIEQIGITDDGESVVVLFADVLPPSVAWTRTERAARGSCTSDGADPVGDYFVNLRLDGGVDLSGLQELAVASGSIVTGRAPVGSVRSLTVTCHGPDETVLAIGLVGDRFVRLEEREDDGLLVMGFFTG